MSKLKGCICVKCSDLRIAEFAKKAKSKERNDAKKEES